MAKPCLIEQVDGKWLMAKAIPGREAVTPPAGRTATSSLGNESEGPNSTPLRNESEEFGLGRHSYSVHLLNCSKKKVPLCRSGAGASDEVSTVH